MEGSESEHGLNGAQQLAVETLYGPLLVIAGAGSGKTRVITLRIVELINQGVSPGAILALTFTNKAAGEMRERVHQLCRHDVLIGTFHSLGVRMLRESIEVLGYSRNFIIYDAEDSEKTIKLSLEELGISLKEVRSEIKTLKQAISRAKNSLRGEEELIEVAEKARAGSIEHALPQLYRAYNAMLKRANAVDFDDLLLLPVEILKNHPEVARFYRSRWRYLLIDEYQDTNSAQYLLVKLLLDDEQNLCVVGDPDQSIYSWRGADISNILNFNRDFPNAKTVHLEHNYRSTSTILDAANAVIAKNSGRYDKRLWSQLGTGDKIKVHAAFDEREEAQSIADAIMRYCARNISYKNMVVFYRTNAQSRALEDRFLLNNIPYVVVGGVSFYDRREIKDVLAFLRLACAENDFVAFLRTVNIPKRGIGDKTIDKIQQEAERRQKPLLATCQELILDVPVDELSVKLTAKQKLALSDYLNVIHSIRLAAEGSSPHQVIVEALRVSRYFEHLATEPETVAERKENLDSLVARALEWQLEKNETSSDLGHTLALFLEELSLRTTLDEASTISNERVHLMTVHNGKGLEYEVVFLAGMEEDLFPHANSRGSYKALEEERRLFYVGMTRAKTHLNISYCRLRYLWGRESYQSPSRFLKELPMSHCEVTEKRKGMSR